MSTILETLYLALPAMIANSIPLVVAKMNIFSFIAVPIDFGIKIRGKRLFGDHKTWRGIIFGIVFGFFTGGIMLFFEMKNIITTEYLNGIEFLFFGTLSGIGALIGDCFKSMIKRQIGIKDGGMWFPFDQIDYLIGMMICTYYFVYWEFNQIIILLILGLVLNPIMNFISYLLGVKEVWY